MIEKRFEIVDEYIIKYDGDYFNMHKSKDVRSIVILVNQIIANGDIDD